MADVEYSGDVLENIFLIFQMPESINNCLKLVLTI